MIYHLSMITADKTDNIDGISLISKKVSSTLSLREMSLRMHDVTAELLVIRIVFENANENERDRKQSLTTIKSSIVPFLNPCSKKLSESANLLAPIAGTNYVSTIKERERKHQHLQVF